jgi:two-component system, chemotaxis family, chemotaxis protein CheY
MVVAEIRRDVQKTKRGKMPKILIVDDSRLMRSIIRQALMAAGYEIAGEAANGKEGVDMFTHFKPDLVTMDLTMPGTQGMESLEQILKLDPKAKVIMVTALSQRLLEEDALKIGAKAMIGKPFEPEELARLVSSLVGPSGADAGKPSAMSVEQVDHLKEVANIGVGNAAGRLADLIGRRCDMALPELATMPLGEIKKLVDLEGSLAVAMRVKLLGDMPGTMFVALKREDAQRLARRLVENGVSPSDDEISMIVLSFMKKIGELLTRAFSDSLNTFLKTKTKYAMPDVVMGTWSNAVDVFSKQDETPAGECLVLRSSFWDDGKSFKGHFLYVLSEETRRVLLDRLKVLG